MATPNPARLSAIGNKTLTLAMERQRLLSISPPSQSPLSTRNAGHNSSSSVAQITRNLNTLREGIVSLESSQETTTIKQAEALREQYANILNVLGEEEVVAAGIPSLPPPPERRKAPVAPPPPPSDTPYRDEPEQSNEDMYLEQNQIMQEQDTQLESLSHSIGRQHHLSLQINDELGEQAVLLDGLDQDLDRTGNRLMSARRTLDKVSRGAKDNCSAVTIGAVIFILLFLIIVFKT